MNISIRHIEHFIAVAQELHFRRAAQLANVAQPALSRSVQTLESELGVQLLARNNRNVRLTAAGKEFLAGCTGIVESMQTTIDKSVRAGKAEFGGLNLGYTYIAMCGALPTLLREFETQNPSITIESAVKSSADQIEQLHHNELDMCFLTGPVSSQEIDSTVFKNDRFVVIANQSNHFANKTSISIEELSREKIILRSEPEGSAFNQHVYKFFREAGLEADFKYLDQDHIGLLGMVALNKGLCIATEGYGCVYAQNLKVLNITGIDAQLPTVLAWRKDVHSQSVSAFRTFMMDRIANAAADQNSSVAPGAPGIPETV